MNTTPVIVNLSPQTVTFHQAFADQLGNPLPVTFKTIPQGDIVTAITAQGTIAPNASLNIQVFDPGPGSTLKIGWSIISYDSTDFRLGGFAIFQNVRTATETFEALVPLSSVGDYKFYMPFDDRAGFVTSMAIVNPSNTSSATVNFTFRDTFANVLATYTATIPPLNQRAFSLEAIAPQIKGFAGDVFVQGSYTAPECPGVSIQPSWRFRNHSHIELVRYVRITKAVAGGEQ